MIPGSERQAFKKLKYVKITHITVVILQFIKLNYKMINTCAIVEQKHLVFLAIQLKNIQMYQHSILLNRQSNH